MAKVSIECGGLGVDLNGEVPCLVHSLWRRGDKRFLKAGYRQMTWNRWDWWLMNPAGQIVRKGSEKTLMEAMVRVRDLFAEVFNE